jgi:hypothetical protein
MRKDLIHGNKNFIHGNKDFIHGNKDFIHSNKYNYINYVVDIIIK